VDDEWSFVETLRQLVFARDAGANRTVLDDPMPYDRLRCTHRAHPLIDAAAIGLISTRGLTEAELERLCARSPAPG